MSPSRRLVLPCILGVLLVAAGCNAGPDDDVSTAGAGSSTVSSPAVPVNDTGGPGAPSASPGEFPIATSGAMVGRMLLDDRGCWTIAVNDQERFVVMPPGFTLDPADGTRLLGPDGIVVSGGTAVDATGSMVSVADLPGGPDGYWGSLIGFCAPGAVEVAVVETVSVAYEPASLEPEGLAELLEDVELTESWGCGYGFAASDAAQTVGLRIYSTVVGVQDVVEIPDAAWIAEVIVGKNLFVGNCNDAWEWWWPQNEIVATWPVTAGTLTGVPTGPVAQCAGGPPITATLVGAVVETPAGEVELGDLTLVNDAYGCFAG